MANLDEAFKMLHNYNPEPVKKSLLPRYEYKCIHCNSKNVYGVTNDGGSRQHCNDCKKMYTAKIKNDDDDIYGIKSSHDRISQKCISAVKNKNNSWASGYCGHGITICYRNKNGIIEESDEVGLSGKHPFTAGLTEIKA
jgi:hypothetical protein